MLEKWNNGLKTDNLRISTLKIPLAVISLQAPAQ